MNIARFEIVVIMDSNRGVACNGKPPGLPLPSWTQYCTELTVGRKNNCVIVGKNTFLDICEGRPIKDRRTYVISSELKQDDYTNVTIYKTLLDCLIGIGNQLQKYDKVFIIGGYTVFKSAVETLLYLCDKIHTAELINVSNDDRRDLMIFPMNELQRRGIVPISEVKPTHDYMRKIYEIKVSHQEEQYLQTLDKLISSDHRYIVEDDQLKRSEIKALHNVHLSFDIEYEFPLITSRQIDYKDIVGDVVDHLKNLDFSSNSIGLALRSYGSIFTVPKRYDDGMDQLSICLESINKDKPYTLLFQDVKAPLFVYVYVSSCKRYLHMSLVFNDVDAFNDINYYIVYFSLISKVLAFLSKKISKKLDVYSTQLSLRSQLYEVVKKQVRRTPKPLTKFELKNLSNLRGFEDIERSNFDIKNYISWSRLFV